VVTTALNVRLAVVSRLQSFLRYAHPGTEIPDAAEHAILLALNPRRKVVNGPFLFRNVLRDARRILARRGREVSLHGLVDESGSTSSDALADGVEHHDDRGHERLQALCHHQTPEAIACAKELEDALRRQLDACRPGAGACLDGLLAGETAAETASRTGVPLGTVNQLRTMVREKARRLTTEEGQQ
jgi:hypothetical protein